MPSSSIFKELSINTKYPYPTMEYFLSEFVKFTRVMFLTSKTRKFVDPWKNHIPAVTASSWDVVWGWVKRWDGVGVGTYVGWWWWWRWRRQQQRQRRWSSLPATHHLNLSSLISCIHTVKELDISDAWQGSIFFCCCCVVIVIGERDTFYHRLHCPSWLELPWQPTDRFIITDHEDRISMSLHRSSPTVNRYLTADRR